MTPSWWPAGSSTSASIAAAPISRRGTRMVLSGGSVTAENSMSSQPTTLRSPGTEKPAPRSAASMPMAITSL